jgi:hypothetical protein
MNLILYTCTAEGCGFVSTQNFRDRCCPVCKVCMKVDVIVLDVHMANLYRREAPHEDEPDV